MAIYQKKAVKKTLIQELGFSLDILPKIKKNTEFHCLSIGQFNLIDIIENIVNQIGQCNVDLAIWTASDANLKKAFEFLKNESVKNMRWVIDPSFRSRQPKYVATLIDRFGDDCIRSLPTHAKFILIYNDKYNVIIQTSMNLNQNKRLENFTIIEDVQMVDFYKKFVNDIFIKKSKKQNFESQNISQVNDLFNQSDDNNLIDF